MLRYFRVLQLCMKKIIKSLSESTEEHNAVMCILKDLLAAKYLLPWLSSAQRILEAIQYV